MIMNSLISIFNDHVAKLITLSCWQFCSLMLFYLHGIYNLFLRMYIFVKEESLITNYGALKKHKIAQISILYVLDCWRTTNLTMTFEQKFFESIHQIYLFEATLYAFNSKKNQNLQLIISILPYKNIFFMITILSQNWHIRQMNCTYKRQNVSLLFYNINLVFSQGSDLYNDAFTCLE